MNILIANVGNIRVSEIKGLAAALNEKNRVTIVSMQADASHRGLAFSFRDTPVRVAPLVYKDVVKSASWVGQKTPGTLASIANISDKKLEAFDGISAYEFHGNPADAISVTLTEIMQHKKPDLVICGINNGVHMGQDIYSSSNIGMAMEAAFFNIPTIAVGIPHKVGGHTEAEVSAAVEFVAKNAMKFADLGLPKHTFLNINVPSVEKYKNLKGVKVAKMGMMSPLSRYVEKTDPSGEKYYWADNVERNNAETSEEVARTWFDRGFVTIVPINYDATDYAAIREWDEENTAKNNVDCHGVVPSLAMTEKKGSAGGSSKAKGGAR